MKKIKWGFLPERFLACRQTFVEELHKKGILGSTRSLFTGKTGQRCTKNPVAGRARQVVAIRSAIDNLQNYGLGMRYGARLRSRLCRRLSTSLVRYRHGLDKFLEHRFIPIRRSFNPHDLPADLLQVQDPFFSGKEANLFDRKRRCMARNRDAIDGVTCLVVVRSFIAYLNLWASFFFFFFFLIMLSRKSSISKTLMQQRRRGHACAVLPVWCAGHNIVKSVRQVPTLTWWSVQPRHVCR